MVEAKIKALRDELERHNYNYYVLSAPTISDFEFDKKMKELQELEAAHPEFADPDSPTRTAAKDSGSSAPADGKDPDSPALTADAERGRSPLLFLLPASLLLLSAGVLFLRRRWK